MYMNEAISSPEACRDIVRKVLTRFRMPYLTVTPLFSVCEKHGYLRGEHEYCPFCDEELLHIHRLRPNRPSVAVADSGTTSLLVEKFTADKYMPSQEFRILFL